MIILDGKKVKENVRADLKKRFSAISIDKRLVIIQVGDRKESSLYINNKIKFGESIGVKLDLFKFPTDIDESALISKIIELNKDHSVGGIIVQLPLPERIDKQNILNSIDINKDIDGLGTRNQEILYSGGKAVFPATARAVMKIISEYNIDLKDKSIAVLGRSNLVGKPTAYLLEKNGGNVTVCNRSTENIKDITKKSDIVVSATGNPLMINKDWVKRGAVIIDVGITSLPDGKLAGDADFDSLKDYVHAISPVPGGVGAVTVAMIFENFLDLVNKTD